MTGYQLAKSRIKSEWKKNVSVLKSSIDWIVVLYIILPFSIFFFFSYLEWWEGLPGWSIGLHGDVFLALMYLVLFSGNVRVYLAEADALFLRQNWLIMKELKLFGLSYSVIVNLLKLVVTFIILAPFIVNSGLLDVNNYIKLGVVLALLQPVLLIGEKAVLTKFKGWKKLFMRGIVFSSGFVVFKLIVLGYSHLANPFIIGFIYSFLLGLTVLVGMRRTKRHHSFNLEIMYEDMKRSVLIQLLYQLASATSSGAIQASKSYPDRRRPLLINRSAKLFKTRYPVIVMAEAYLKVFLRNRQYSFTFLQMTGVTVAVLILVEPLWIKILIGGLFWVVATKITKRIIEEIARSGMSVLVDFNKDIQDVAIQLAVLLISPPVKLAVLSVVVFRMFAGVGVILFLSFGVLFHYLWWKRHHTAESLSL